jgi:hypothetical protein
MTVQTGRPDPGVVELIGAFPVGNDRVRIVFSGPVDEKSASRPEAYRSAVGLGIKSAEVTPHGNGDNERSAVRVSLSTEPMNGYSLVVDTITAEGVRSSSGAALRSGESPPFIQGIASIPGIQWPLADEFPFTSRFEGLVATASCQKDGGVNSNKLIDTFGCCFLHVERGGPFNSIKVTTDKHVPGIDEAVKELHPRGLSPHVLWSGGEIRTVDGETRLVDTGLMEGSILDATPKHFPPPFRVRTSDLAGDDATTLRSRSLQGVIVRFENITIDAVANPNAHDTWVSAPDLRSFTFHDESGKSLTAVVVDSVQRVVRPGDTFESLRALMHQPRRGHYEAIVELDDHFDYPLGWPDGLSRRA